MDFGALGELKQFLKDTFDHKTLIAENDPNLSMFANMHSEKLIDLKVCNGVGVEAFAALVFEKAQEIVSWTTDRRCFVESVQCWEHGANSAIVKR